jgi:carboxylesterase
MARVLCLHGLGGTGATMQPLADALSAIGHDVGAPSLPGHGSQPEDLIGIAWDDWLDSTHSFEPDVVVGQSMGAMLGLAMAAERRCRAAVVINPVATDPDAVEALEWRLSRGHEWLELGPSTVDEVAYARLPLAAVLAMHRGIATVVLTDVRVPVLIVTSANDEVVDPAGSDAVAAALGASVQRVTLHLGGHVATLDADRDTLIAAVIEFVADQV